MKNLQYPQVFSSSNKLLNMALGIILVVILVWILIIGKTIILPFMIALFLSLILEPVVNLLTRLKLPMGLAVFLTLIFAFIVLYLLGLLVYSNVQTFVGQFPVYEERLRDWIVDINKSLEGYLGEPLNIKMWKRIDWVNTLQNYSIARGVLSSVGTFVTFIFKMLLVIIFIAYLLMGKRNVSKKISRAFPGKQAEMFISIMNNVTLQVQRYLGTKTIISFFTGAVSIIIFISFGLDFAFFWGFIIFLFNFIPNIGSIMATMLPVLFSILQFGHISTGLWILLSVTILQIFMGNVIEPKLMGMSLNLSPIIVIMALIFWGYIWGIAGMILAVPILGTVTIICENVESLKFISVFLRGKS